jgi:P pilus assembly chaperone PapD
MRTLLLPLLLGALAAGEAVAQTPPPSTPPPAGPAASAFLNVTPKRLTFDRGRRVGTVFLLNQGTAPVTVDIGLVDRVMLTDGQILAVEDAAQRADGKSAVDALKSAKDLLQVSPRRVTLQPGRPQTVRVRLSAAPEGESAERRTHLTFTTLPPREAGATAEAQAAGPGQGQLSFQIHAVYGISIPLIVRPGEAQVQAVLEGARVQLAETPGGAAAPVVALDLVRGGASSVYGNFEVRVVGGRKDAEPLGLARGVGVYPEVARRVVRIPLTRPPTPGEKLEVTFTDDDTSPGKVLAKAVF